ncbi:zinc finger protein 37 homolog isoform X2 [Anabrus simplex]|uniref:zinc finger protein 37 homolog isoform X2 n=1 Tax=Anabrus simplex TaxID=316456 RepID=UPI0035A39621
MSLADTVVRKTFMNFESFLQKVARLDVFEVLVFNYKIKMGLMDPLVVHFLSMVTELAHQLEILAQGCNDSKDILPEIPVSVPQDISLIDEGANLANNIPLEKLEGAEVICPLLPSVPALCKDESSDKSHLEKIEKDDISVDYVEDKSDSDSKKADDLDRTDRRVKKDARVCHKCDLCNRKFPSRTKLILHVARCPMTKDKIKLEGLFCEDCDLSFTSQQLLDSHINKNHKPPSTIPDEISGSNGADESCPSLDDLPDNLPFFCCKKCYTVYRSSAEFQYHSCKDGGRNVTPSAKMSDREHLSGKNLITSVERLKLLRKYRCSICREEYRSMNRILYHLPRCTYGPYKCEVCSSEYSTRKDLNLHKKKAHRDTNSFFCDECGLAFKLRTSLQKHKVSRHERHQGSFTCDVCQKTFLKRIQLTHHKIRLHRLERKYLCQVCGNKFCTHGSLQTHLDSHTELRRFACAYCNKKFRQKEKLKFHTRIHTVFFISGERPYLCQTCGKGFIRKSKLDDHMRRHRGEKRYECQLCDKNYANNWDLKIHMKKLHGGEAEPATQAASSNVESESSAETSAAPRLPVAPEENLLVMPSAVPDVDSIGQMEVPQMVQPPPPSNDMVVHSSSNPSESGILLQLNTIQPTSNQLVAATGDVPPTDGSNNRILVQVDPSQLQNQIMSGENTSSPILVHLNQGGDVSRILLHLDPSQTQATSQALLPGQPLPPNTIMAMADTIHLAPMIDDVNNLNLGGVPTQYIHLAAPAPQGGTGPAATTTGAAGSIPMHIQLPLSAITQQGSASTTYGLQSVPVQVFTTPAGFDVNSITY